MPNQLSLRVMQDVNQKHRRLAAEQRLGNDIVTAQLVEPLENWAKGEKGKSLCETKEYKRAIECEMAHYGNGLKYFLKIPIIARLAA